MAGERAFLFLQGPASPFFGRLARALRARGHEIRRINFCLGDRLFWPGLARAYRGTFADWDGFLRRYLEREGITDIVLFGDCRGYHRTAVRLAGERGVAVHVFEEGYIRPNFITLERGGVNGHSVFPRDPQVLLARANGLPAVEDRPLGGGFSRRVAWDIVYNIATVFGRPFYFGYRRHRPRHPFLEYAAWLRRMTRDRRNARFAVAETARLMAQPGGFYLIPLQLDSDFQIREHSRFGNNGVFLREVIESFARHAPLQTHLLVKVHPLDNGLIDRNRQVAALAESFGVGARVSCIDGGHLPTLLDAARGVVLVNSTTGTQSLHQGRPTVALGEAVYNTPGLTFQGPLDAFWTDGAPPDRDIYEAFYRLVVHETQIAGSFFSADGMIAAVAGSAARLGTAP